MLVQASRNDDLLTDHEITHKLTFETTVEAIPMFNSVFDLEQFAADNRLVIKRDSCGEPCIVPGIQRRSEDISHLYAHSETKLGLVLLFDTSSLWKNAKKRLLGLGFVLHQDGDTEGILLLDHTNAVQVTAAIKEAHLKKHYRFTESHRAVLAVNMELARVANQAKRSAKPVQDSEVE